MTANKNVENGFQFLARIMTGKHCYSSYKEGEEPFSVSGLPIVDDCFYLQFVGSEGMTASIGPWIKRVMSAITHWKYNPPITSYLRRIEMDASEDNTHEHMLFFSVVLGDEDEIMCGGCTDFSGEGGKGGEDAMNFLRLLATVFNTTIVIDHFDYETYKKTSQMLIDAESRASEN